MNLIKRAFLRCSGWVAWRVIYLFTASSLLKEFFIYTLYTYCIFCACHICISFISLCIFLFDMKCILRFFVPYILQILHIAHILTIYNNFQHATIICHRLKSFMHCQYHLSWDDFPVNRPLTGWNDRNHAVWDALGGNDFHTSRTQLSIQQTTKCCLWVQVMEHQRWVFCWVTKNLRWT